MARRPSRRDLLKALGLGAASVFAPRRLSGAKAADAETKPNFILIMADDLGYADVGCYGCKTIRTPHIDALAARGMRLTDYHSNGAVCSPTRAALLTGRYQQRSGIEGVVTAKGHRHTGLAPAETTFAEVLKSAGYVTGLFGKWHLGYRVEFNPIRQGFDEFRGYVSGNVDYHSHIDQVGEEDWWAGEKLTPEKGYSTDLISKHGEAFIERHRDRPFCLYLPHEAPHYPLQGRNDKADRSPGKPQPIWGSRKDQAAAYKEMIEAMDDGVGRIVQTVRRLGLQRRTLIVFCSDNGPARPGSAGPLRGKKGSLWEGGHRVPGMACWPGKIPPGTTSDETILGMDLYATMAAAAGADLPAGLKLDGVSILPVLTGKGKLPERTLFWRTARQRAVRKSSWKLVVSKAGGRKRARKPDKQKPFAGRDTVELFNLAADLGEKTNLADKHPDRVRQLRAELAAWEKQVSEGVTKRT